MTFFGADVISTMWSNGWGPNRQSTQKNVAGSRARFLHDLGRFAQVLTAACPEAARLKTGNQPLVDSILRDKREISSWETLT